MRKQVSKNDIPVSARMPVMEGVGGSQAGRNRLYKAFKQLIRPFNMYFNGTH